MGHSQHLKMMPENVNTKVGELVGFDRTTPKQTKLCQDNKGGHAMPYDSEYSIKKPNITNANYRCLSGVITHEPWL